MITYKNLNRKLKLRELGYHFDDLDPLFDFLNTVKKKSEIRKISTHRYILLIDGIGLADIYYTRENYNLKIYYTHLFPIGEELTRKFTEFYVPQRLKIHGGDQLMEIIGNRKEFLQDYMTGHLIKPMLKKIPDAEL